MRLPKIHLQAAPFQTEAQKIVSYRHYIMVHRSSYLTLAVVSLCAMAGSARLQAQAHAEILPADVKIAHFAELDRNVFVGSKPHSDQDFEFLRSKHVHTIVNARFWNWFSGSERKKAQRYGMTLISLPMNASPIPPFEKHVDQILLTLRNEQAQPVYLHCVLGRDRTGLIAGLYRIRFLAVPKEQAYAEMRQSGFPSWFGVLGLKWYFDKHAGGKAPDLAAAGGLP